MERRLETAILAVAGLAVRGPESGSAGQRHATALVLIALATILRLAIAPQEAGLPYVTYFPAVTLTAVLGGLGPAALASVLGSVLAAWLFIPPFGSLIIKPEAWGSTLVFCAEEVIVCLVIEATRRYHQKNREAGAQLERAHASERQARLVAERANAAKSRFLAAASHDLRQPYQALRLYHAALRSPSINDAQRDTILDKMELAMSAGEELLRSLLDLSTLDAGVVQPHWSEVPVSDIVATLDATHRGPAESKGLSLRLRGVAGPIRTDRTLLLRILDNLVANAIRYTSSGGILVAVRRRPGHILFEIWDTGIGIASEHQQAVFEEFYQVRNPERDRIKGTGVGLAVAAKTAGLLGGKLTLTSRPGHGTRFRLDLPAG